MPSKPSPFRWRHLALLLALGALFLLPALDRLVMSRQQELRIALSARTMAQGGSWLLPEYLGELRVRKPPLMNWLVASAYRLAGTTHSAGVARLPSALSGVALMALLYLAGARALGRRRAFMAGLVCGTSFIILRQGRLAETDVLLTFFTAGAALAGFHALRGPAHRVWWLAAGLCAGLGFMTKGPAAIIFPLLALVAYSLCRRDSGPGWKSWFPLGGLLACALVALPWYVWIMGGGGSEAVKLQLQDEVARATTESLHPGPVYYYLYTAIHGLAPWSLLLPSALLWAWRHRHRRLPLFALLWLATTFLVLSLISSKQIHYTALLVPPASLLVGDFLAAGLSAAVPRGRAARVLLSILLAGGVAMGLALAVVPWLPGNGLPRLVLTVMGATTALVSAWGLMERRQPRRAFAAWITVLWFACGAGAWIIQPFVKEARAIPEAANCARALLEAAPRVLTAGAHVPVLEFYAGRPVRYFAEPRAAWRAAAPGDVLLVARRGGTSMGTPLVQRNVDDFLCEVLQKPAR